MSSIIDSERFRERKTAASRGSGGNDGGCVEDILRRLGVVETLVAETRADVSAIKAVQPHLATKADIHALETKIIKWIIGTVIATGALGFSIAKFVG
jgi:hypothetical protein